MSFYNCKSALMVAGDKLKHLEKIDVLKCDIAIINLEDVSYDKDFAREQVVTLLLILRVLILLNASFVSIDR